MRLYCAVKPVRFFNRLLLGLIAAACVLPCAFLSCAFAQQPQQSATLAEQYLLAAANQERASRGLGMLHRDQQLARAAAQHAGVMAAHQSISHQFPGEPELTDRGARAGVAFSAISENVAEAPSVIQIHDMWMNSEHHRANLLDPAIDSAGISVVVRGRELYAVEDFAKSVRAVSLEGQESAIASLLAQHGQIAVANDTDSISTARETCTMETGFAGSRKPWFVMRFTSDSLTRLPDELTSRLASGKYHEAVVGACTVDRQSAFTSYNFAVLLYP
jgi:hypothetical protein